MPTLARDRRPTSGKSTQNAFIFNPYKKLAKLSLNRDRLSCKSWRCMKLASRSAIESENSANCGSSELIAGCSVCVPVGLPPKLCSRREDLELGRRGVVGREEGSGRDVERWLFGSMATSLKGRKYNTTESSA
ncbi:conserved hypothetical protein [Uncinocarpus reesii 1704]|uniref:Uncharacterized protein n=1 Tax=Uncinocarpus reesii (strain UAMH 1704) TaxID=336963 RepID=C4JSH9_UNCRE|nr:uncharacterized protein UREG_05418 [Uncinocarpus reesii 1704]EEP80576.1 conserved hypothetical protein [Uncinocarpus reesii 1704]